uniref:Reverse transcriptase domain-containing protein n=1 Tax=Tanacetum cinerariifolium TaxID=118510 RepID=A0A699GKX1_TANCI|nr:reverse transcriptase domain-containing protein [Tanacetum cinerariifolium]
MRTRYSSNLPVESSPNPTTSNPKRRNRRRSKKPFILEESPVDMMADQRTMAKLLRVPTEGYAEAIVVPPILAEQFELKHSLINMITSDHFFRLEKDNPHDHIRWFNKITSTIKYKDVPNSMIKLMLFPFSLTGAAHRWLEKEPSRSILTWEDLVSKFINEFFPPQEQQIPVIDANSSSSSEIAKLTHAVNQQTSDVTTTMTTILKQFQETSPLAFMKAVEEIYVTCGGAHPYYQCLTAGGNTFLELQDNIQGYVAVATVNYNQGNADSILEDSLDEDNLADTMPEMFTEEHALDYSSPPLYDEYDDDFFEVESDTEYVYDDPFDSKGEKIEDSKLLIDELDLPKSSDFLPSSEYDPFLFKDFSKVDALPSTDNEDKDFNHPLYELPFLKELLGSETLLSFSSENEEKVFKPEILTSKGVHSSLILELSHRGYKVFKIIEILKSPMEIFLFFHGEDIRIFDVPCTHFYPP